MERQPIDTGIAQRGYRWQCAIPTDKIRFIANGDDKLKPCGRWNPVFTRKWAATKGDSKWQGVCTCKRKRQLNLGVVEPEPPNYYETRKETIEAADDANAQEELIQAKRNQEASRRVL